MVRDNRVKEYFFTAVAPSGTGVVGSTSHPLNGQILEVEASFNRAGSFFLNAQRSSESIIAIAAASGTNPQVWRPRTIEHDNTGAVAVGSPYDVYAMHDHVVLGVSGAASGAGPLTVYLRYV